MAELVELERRTVSPWVLTDPEVYRAEQMLDPAAPIALRNKEDVRTLYRSILAAFSDIRFEVTGRIAESDMVFAALHTTGHGAGDFMGRDMRGKPVAVFEAMFAHVEGEKFPGRNFLATRPHAKNNWHDPGGKGLSGEQPLNRHGGKHHEDYHE